tara:strand:- start:26 stop:436 length:411 start_codon:yes stop_codon:yes gene_type:complete
MYLNKIIIVFGVLCMLLPFGIIFYFILCKKKSHFLLDFDDNLDRIVIYTNENEDIEYKLDDYLKLLEEINNNKPFKIIVNNIPDKECSICLEKIGDSICILNCNHGYHFNCIKKWVYDDKNNSCPQCRCLVFDYTI